MEWDALGWGFRMHRENALLLLTPRALGRAPLYIQMGAK